MLTASLQRRRRRDWGDNHMGRGFAILAILAVLVRWGNSFTPQPLFATRVQQANRSRWGTQRSGFALFALPDIQTMKPQEMRAELESYGIATNTFLEKKELKEALQAARASGAVPKKKKDEKESSAKAESTKVNGDAGMSREDRILEEMEKAKSMKVAELKKALEDRGVSTRSFFEKSEFVRAYAEAVVDGTQAKTTSSSRTRRDEDDNDPSYRTVVMRKMNHRDPLTFRGPIIDVSVSV